MIKRTSALSIAFFVFLLLAACTANAANIAVLNTLPANSNSTGGNNSSSGNTAIENRLAPGILKLEGTNLAVSKQQAAQLLPLWQKISSLETSGNAQSSDYTTVYQQIEAALTTEQVNAIQSMSFTQSDIQALMTSLGIQITPGAFGGSRPTLSPDQQATRSAQRTQTPGANGSGNFARGTGTPGAGFQFGNRGMNFLFLNPLIQLLQQRAGS